MPAQIRLPTAWEGLKSLAVFARNTEQQIDKSRVLDAYTVATVPDAASNLNRLIIVTDESTGCRTAVSDGTDWLRTTDSLAIS